jgi:hypothetical protein
VQSYGQRTSRRAMSNRFRFRFQNFSFSNILERQREWRDVIPLPLEAVASPVHVHTLPWHPPLVAGGIRLRVAAASQRADGAVPLPLAVRVSRRQCGAFAPFPQWAAGVTRTRRGDSEGQQARARGQALSQSRRRPPHSPSRPIQVPRPGPRALHEKRIGPSRCQTIRASAGDPRPAGRAWPTAPACIARGSVGSCTGQAAQCSLLTTSVYHFFRWGIPDKEPERKAFSALFAALLRVERGFIWVDAPCPSSGTGQGGATVPKANRRDGLVGWGRRSSLDNSDVA